MSVHSSRTFSHGSRLLLLVLTLSCARFTFADDWVYTVRPGDDLWTIAAQFCGSSKRAEDIARVNNLADPKNIRAGTRVTIPTRWLAFAPSKATISALAGDVRIQRYGSRANTAASGGTELDMGDRLITQSGSAEITFADGSTLTVAPFSEVMLNKLTAFGPAGMVDTHLRFFNGQGEAKVKKQNLGDRFRIQTPEGIAAVRGTEFRIGHDQTSQNLATSRTETMTGRVVFTDNTKQVIDLPGGFGVISSAGNSAREALLAGPTWHRHDTEISPEGQLSWDPLEGADAYAVTWYPSDNPEVIANLERVSDNRSPVPVSPGAFNVAVRGISKAGIHGYDSLTQVNVLHPAPKPAEVLGDDVDEEVRSIQLRWQHDIDTDFYIQVTAAGETTKQYRTSDKHLFLDLPAGAYQWQVTADGASDSEIQSFTLVPPAPINIATTSRGKNLRIQWEPLLEASEYQIRVTSSSGQVLLDSMTHASNISVNVDDFGTHTIELRSIQNGITSPWRTHEAVAQRSGWWLLLIAAPLLFL
ncbi:MAG: FecR domain-containing protein [Pseudomonadota bacterium]